MKRLLFVPWLVFVLLRWLSSLLGLAEKAILWDTGTTGDGTTTYTQAEATAFWGYWFTPNTVITDPHASQGVLLGVGGELAVTGASSPVSVATGSAVVEGFPYRNTAAVTVAIPTPAASTRIDRIVLRASHGVTRTVRITRIAGTEGAGAPALTQVAGTTWDIPLAQCSITTGGVITVTDQRTFCYFATKVKTSMLDDDAVTNPKIRNSGALSVIGRSANSSGDPADISAVAASGAVLRESGSVLGFGTVATAGIANDAVDDTKAGNRVPQFYRRQGGSATDWSIAGVTTQTPTAVRMQAGKRNNTGSPTPTTTFPVAFSQPPLVIAVASSGGVILNVTSTSATNFTVDMTHPTLGPTADEFTWFAVGAE